MRHGADDDNGGCAAPHNLRGYGNPPGGDVAS
jgi:hypothetical protein